MLAELAAANAAFGVIKSAITNSKELVDVSKSIAAFVGAEDDLKAKADKNRKVHGTSSLVRKPPILKSSWRWRKSGNKKTSFAL